MLNPNKLLIKKFSIGTSLQISLDEYKYIINNYGKYIHDIYFSPPLGDKYHSRTTVMKELACIKAHDYLFEVLNLFKANGILIELALNTYNLADEDIINAIQYITSIIEIDSIVTLNEYGHIVKKIIPNKQIIYSYNNGVRTQSDIDNIDNIFNEIVLGNSAIRNFNLVSYAKTKKFITKLLINNGCSFNCLWCRNDNLCKSIFEKNLKYFTVEQLYAMQSIFPWELHKYYLNNNNIDRLKISNRPCSFDYLTKCLYSYINNYDQDLIKNNVGYYHLWGRLGQIPHFYRSFDFKRINEFKKMLWENQIDLSMFT